MFGFFLSVGFVGLLYLAIGFFINKNNARYLLAGYNTMDEEKRQKFPIDNYLVFFKKIFYWNVFFLIFVCNLPISTFSSRYRGFNLGSASSYFSFLFYCSKLKILK